MTSGICKLGDLDGAGIEIELTLSHTLFEYTPWLDKREGSGC